ncbi:AAA family ATPase [Bacteroides sp. UBA939]|uniref:AAA family ATPase n=1 Tax=Bacteroides sp. UBA939 TaxID=1946092 RepID=UPI0025C0DE50|nr:ATP-binding protein [Bacteroides sp. UBA939]
MVHLIEFTVGNFLSFNEKKTLSMEAAGIRELPENTFVKGDCKLLKSAVVYGANSSGKSNLIKAMEFMRKTILNSSKMNSTDKLGVSSFQLNAETAQSPSFFEILFYDYNTRYRYGFELDNERIHAEWLYTLPSHNTKKEQLLFIRDSEGIAVNNSFQGASGLEERTRDNGLFLSVCDQFNVPIAKKLVYAVNSITIVSGVNHDQLITMTSIFMENNTQLTKGFFQKLQLGFIDINRITDKRGWIDKALTTHNVYDVKGNIEGQHHFKIVESESAGTNKIYDLTGHLLFALQSGITLIIDELDAKLHPLLTKKIVEMFHSNELNKNGAQLIFATHDTNLLGCNCFRRDQIWFTEKNRKEETDLYSLVEFRNVEGTKVRNDRNYEKDYIEGRYGAIPFIGDFSNLMKNGEKERD